MVVGNVELLYECFLKYARMGTARMKQDKETEGKKRGESMERSKAGTKEKRCTDGISIARAYRPSGGRYAPKHWINYLTNLQR